MPRLKDKVAIMTGGGGIGKAIARRFGAEGAKVVVVLLWWLATIFLNVPAWAEGEFAPSSVKKGALLVASPSLDDPNFRQSVLLIVEHGSGGTVGLILNRSTKVLLSEAFPDLAFLKGTSHRVFVGGPVNPGRLLLLFRLKEPDKSARSVFDGVYVGGTQALLERVITQPKPTETFRAFAGHAGWAPGQLESEMLQGAWGVLPPGTFNIFDKDSATLWPDSITHLQAPRVISNRQNVEKVRAYGDHSDPGLSRKVNRAISTRPESNHAHPAIHFLWQNENRLIRSTTPPISPARPVPNALIVLSLPDQDRDATATARPKAAKPAPLEFSASVSGANGARTFYTFTHGRKTFRLGCGREGPPERPVRRIAIMAVESIEGAPLRSGRSRPRSRRQLRFSVFRCRVPAYPACSRFHRSWLLLR
jgi:putative transcriptional regulator